MKLMVWQGPASPSKLYLLSCGGEGGGEAGEAKQARDLTFMEGRDYGRVIYKRM